MALEDPDAEQIACDNEGRGHSDASASRGRQELWAPTRSWQGAPSEPQKEPTLPTADFGLPARRTGRQQIPAVIAMGLWHLAVAQGPSWPAQRLPSVCPGGEREQRHAPLNG